MPKTKLMTVRQFAEESSLTYRQVVYRIGTGQIKAEKHGWSPMILDVEIERIRDEEWYRECRKTVAANA